MSTLPDRCAKLEGFIPENLNSFVFNSRNFYPNACHLCPPSSDSYLDNTRDNLILCDKCNMISYCGEAHKTIHKREHQDLCEVVQKLLKSKGTTNLFGYLRDLAEEPDKRFNATFKLISDVEKELKRKLYEDEQQMFLYPKFCNVCLETEPDSLKMCKSCPQVSLCTNHYWGESIHATMTCIEFRMCYNLDYAIQIEAKLIKESRNEVDNRYDVYCISSDSFPILFPNPETFEPLKNMEIFMDYIEKGKTRIMNIFDNSYWQYMCSQLYTNILTLMNVIRRLELEVQSQMVIHIVGIQNSRRKVFETHELILHLFPQLTILKVIVIGEELDQDDVKITRQLSLCHKCIAESKVLFVESSKVPYVDYIGSPAFETPQLIITYNFGDSAVHKWDESLSEIMVKLKVPFVMTTNTELRAEEEYTKIKKRFGKLRRMSFCELNHFASLRPYRNARENNLKYENDYICAFTLFKLPSYASKDSPTSAENIEQSLEGNSGKKDAGEEKAMQNSPNLAENIEQSLEGNSDKKDAGEEQGMKKFMRKYSKKSKQASNPAGEQSSLDKEEKLKDAKKKDVTGTLGSQSHPTEESKSETGESSKYSDEEDELDGSPKKTKSKFEELEKENKQLNMIISQYASELPIFKKCSIPVAFNLLEEHVALKLCLDELEESLLEVFKTK